MPREWPPASVWLAVLALIGAPLAATVYAIATATGYLACFTFGGVLFGIAPSVGLLRGWPSGVTGGRAYAGIVAGLFTLMFLTAVESVGFAGAVRSGMLAFVAWAGVVLALLWWPETRRWCGILLPADPEDSV